MTCPWTWGISRFLTAALMIASPFGWGTQAPDPKILVAPLKDPLAISELNKKVNSGKATFEEISQLNVSTSIGFIPQRTSERSIRCSVLSIASADAKSDRPHLFVVDAACLDWTSDGGCSKNYFYFHSYFGRIKVFQCQRLSIDPLDVLSGPILVTARGPNQYQSIHDIKTITVDPLRIHAPQSGATLLLMGWSPYRGFGVKDCRYGLDPSGNDHSLLNGSQVQAAKGFLIHCDHHEFEATRGAAILDPAHGYSVIGILKSRLPQVGSSWHTYIASRIPEVP